MIASRRIMLVLAMVLLASGLTGCGETRNPSFQGWVEADMIFVSPDEQGRVVKLNVREGDKVEVGMPLYAVDDDLQQASLNQSNATLANAQQAYDRAASLSKTGSGTQASLDSALAALRVAEAQVNTSQTRLARRRMNAPIAGTIQQIYFREGETVPAQKPVISILPPGNMKVRFFVRSGPAKVVGDDLVFLPVPVRTRWPVKITVVAWQLGRGGDKPVRAADLVEQSFLLDGPPRP